MKVHTSYEVSKRLKEFMGESAPEPMDKKCYEDKFGSIVCAWYKSSSYPAYQLHDLLSKPFCEAFVKVGAKRFGFGEDEITDFVADWSTEMAHAYWNGGLEAVEAALMKMMDGEGA